MTTDNSLFTNRTPEAAATQLAVVLAWATECNLATLERLQLLKSSSRYAINRQQEICDTLVYHCKDLNVEPFGKGRMLMRLKEKLQELQDNPKALADLNQRISRY